MQRHHGFLRGLYHAHLIHFQIRMMHHRCLLFGVHKNVMTSVRLNSCATPHGCQSYHKEWPAKGSQQHQRMKVNVVRVHVSVVGVGWYRRDHNVSSHIFVRGFPPYFPRGFPSCCSAVPLLSFLRGPPSAQRALCGPCAARVLDNVLLR